MLAEKYSGADPMPKKQVIRSLIGIVVGAFLLLAFLMLTRMTHC
jgi:hypothetical protein